MKPLKIACTEAFKKDFQRLPDVVREEAAKQITQLLLDYNHPSLKLEAIVGHRHLFSIRIDQEYRISLSFPGEDVILLRRVLGPNDLSQTVDEDSWDELPSEIYPRLKTLMIRYRIPSEDADNILQQAYLALVAHAGEVRDPEEWLIGTAKNLCLLYWREKRRATYSEVEPP